MLETFRKATGQKGARSAPALASIAVILSSLSLAAYVLNSQAVRDFLSETTRLFNKFIL